MEVWREINREKQKLASYDYYTAHFSSVDSRCRAHSARKRGYVLVHIGRTRTDDVLAFSVLCFFLSPSSSTPFRRWRGRWRRKTPFLDTYLPSFPQSLRRLLFSHLFSLLLSRSLRTFHRQKNLVPWASTRAPPPMDIERGCLKEIGSEKTVVQMPLAVAEPA